MTLGRPATIVTAIALAAAITATTSFIPWGGPADAAPQLTATTARASTVTRVISTRPAHVTPNLDPGTIGLCNSGFGQVSVAHATAVKIGRVDLRCGDSRTGYVHIRSVWESSWRNAIAGAPGNRLWDDFAVFAINRALTHPRSGYPRKDGPILCYATTIRVTNASGHLILALNPTVTVSSATKDVVSAAPTATPTCSIR